MIYELIFTSVPKGLQAGKSGFTTAAATAGMSTRMRMLLESLSGYGFLYNLSDSRSNLNPVTYSHIRVKAGANSYGVLSRIAFAGADYSGRANKIAHHFLLTDDERPQQGPGRLLMALRSGAFVTEYAGPPKELPPRTMDQLLAGQRPPAAGGAWQSLTGDAGWAGVLPRAFRTRPKVPASVVFEPGTDLLPAFAESLNVLPASERWAVCFSTYYSANLPVGTACHWRGVVPGAPQLQEVRRHPGATVIDLTASLPALAEDEYVRAARAGKSVADGRRAASSRAGTVDVRQALAAVPVGEEDEEEFEPDVFELAQEEMGGPAVPPSAETFARPVPYPRSSEPARSGRTRWAVALAAIAILFVSNIIFAVLYLTSRPGPGPKSKTAPIARAEADAGGGKDSAGNNAAGGSEDEHAPTSQEAAEEGTEGAAAAAAGGTDAGQPGTGGEDDAASADTLANQNEPAGSGTGGSEEKPLDADGERGDTNGVDNENQPAGPQSAGSGDDGHTAEQAQAGGQSNSATEAAEDTASQNNGTDDSPAPKWWERPPIPHSQWKDYEARALLPAGDESAPQTTWKIPKDVTVDGWAEVPEGFPLSLDQADNVLIVSEKDGGELLRCTVDPSRPVVVLEPRESPDRPKWRNSETDESPATHASPETLTVAMIGKAEDGPRPCLYYCSLGGTPQEAIPIELALDQYGEPTKTVSDDESLFRGYPWPKKLLMEAGTESISTQWGSEDVSIRFWLLLETDESESPALVLTLRSNLQDQIEGRLQTIERDRTADFNVAREISRDPKGHGRKEILNAIGRLKKCKTTKARSLVNTANTQDNPFDEACRSYIVALVKQWEQEKATLRGFLKALESEAEKEPGIRLKVLDPWKRPVLDVRVRIRVKDEEDK